MGFTIFDGAMGTMLQNSGLPAGHLPELYNLSHPDVVLGIHKSYVEAGADIISANTFQANANKLKGCGYSVGEVVSAGVRLAKSSGAKQVALDVGPTGALMEPLGDFSFDDAYELFREQIIAGCDAGADLILLETFGNLYEAKAAILAAKENSELPVYCTMTFGGDGRTFAGTDVETAVITLQALGVDAVGINCSTGPLEILPLAERMLKYAKIPVIIQPNAGLPKIDPETGGTIYDAEIDVFTDCMGRLATAGVRMFGGCCGTTPAHIKVLKEITELLRPVYPQPVIVTAATSATRTVIFDDGVTLVGERINPTGRSKFKDAFRSGDYSYIISEALNQARAGADLLDINAGLPEIDETEALVRMVREIPAVTDVPLQIDSTNPEAIEAAVRYYNGRPVINSVNGKLLAMEMILPIAKKYGAVVVGLTMDDSGIPESAYTRLQIAEKILRTALHHGLAKEDLIIDCLVMTASSHQRMAAESLATIKLVKSNLGLKTMLGISNLSFGLPSRELLDSVYLSAALGAGVDAPIINVLSPDIMRTVAAYRVIDGTDTGAKKYIGLVGESGVSRPNTDSDSPENRSIINIIIDGRKDEAADAVTELLKTAPASEIIDRYFVPALDIVGEQYERGEIFLPQLIQSAETVKAASGPLRSVHAGQMSKGKVLLATVKGDIHDIGKNIVRILLENYGYEVVDLGKDVMPERIAAEAKSHEIRLVGLSALMTTTVESLKETISLLRQSCDCKIMVGGAVMSQEYSDMVGADFYGSDARDAVKIAGRCFGR